MNRDKFTLADRFKDATENVWVEFTRLAVDTKSLNLGQGFPDFPPPQLVSEQLQAVAACGDVSVQQYTRSFGHPRLVNAIAKLYSILHGGRQIDPLNEVLVSVGAYGCLFYAIQGLISPGDEVILIEPFYDCYAPMVRVAGGKPVFVPLRPNYRPGQPKLSSDWKWDDKELEAAFTERTKMIVINTPNNPLGKVHTRRELEKVAELCRKHNVLAIADEVYEFMVYGHGASDASSAEQSGNEANKHIRLATLEGMWDRTITVSSVGKMLNVTGWKLGWAIAPNALLNRLQVVHQNSVYTCSTVLQEAVARSIELETVRYQAGDPECFLRSNATSLIAKRDRLAAALAEAGFDPIIPQGGYFMLADIGHLAEKLPPGALDKFGSATECLDYKFVRWMAHTHKLACIPPTAFYSTEHRNIAEKYIRLCFIKREETIDAAVRLLTTWRNESH